MLEGDEAPNRVLEKRAEGEQHLERRTPMPIRGLVSQSLYTEGEPLTLERRKHVPRRLSLLTDVKIDNRSS